jgi:hypothetical protein
MAAMRSRNIDAGSRKPARCLRPESDAPDVFLVFPHPNNPKLGSRGLKDVCSKFSMERDKMISDTTKRSIFRWIHIVFAIPIAGYVYSPFKELPNYAPVVRFVSIPVLVLTGLWMWKGHVLRRLISKRSA